ncbi:MAG: YafY family transcriptional regulator [Bacteroidia bacterium]|nr:YafY family transcriptional regulator [Bacteroidia bacterium]
MNRIERISAILIQLQSKPVVRAEDIAKRFQISLRTVYRDIRALEATGVPIIGEAGVGYSLVEGYKLPPVQFTLSEASAFITAEKLIERLTDKSLNESYQSAMFKVKSVMRNAEKKHLETLEENIAVIQNPFVPEPDKKPDFMHLIIAAIANKQVLKLTYFANYNQAETSREIEPIGMFFQLGKWHLIAYCHLRNDYRNFRMDRVSALQESTKKYSKIHPTLKKFLKQIAQKENLNEVVLKFENKAVKFIDEQKYYNGFVSQKATQNHTEMTFLVSHLEGMLRWYVMYADYAEIISPPELKTAAVDYVKKIHSKLKK